MYILNEVPTGVIDGVNKAYTTAQTLYQAVVITVDGVIYTGGVTFAGNVFTLDDAPTASITISYYDSAISTTVTGSLLVSTVYSAFSRLKQDVSDVSTTTFMDWADWVNKFAYRHVAGIDSERYISEATITATAGQDWAYLPVDFRDITKFGCGLYLYTDGIRSEVQSVLTNPNSSTEGFYIKNDRIYFRPTPTQAQTYMLRYVPSEPTLTALTDYFSAPLDARYTQYLVNAIDILYDQWDEQSSDESLADFRFARLLDELSRNVKQSPAVYILDDSTLNF